MNEFAFELPTLLTASLTLGVSAVVAWAALAWLQPSNNKVYWVVWLAVLINGMMLIRMPIDLPVLHPDSTHSFSGLLGSPVQAGPSSDSDRVESAVDKRTADAVASVATVEGPSKVPIELHPVVESTPAISVARPRYRLANIIFWAWLTGFTLVLSYLTLGYFQFLRCFREAVSAPESWSRQLNEELRKAGCSRELPMFVHDKLGPCLALCPNGFQIVVPGKLWARLDSNQRSAILKHEIAHYRRGDVLVSLFAYLVASIHWFNPLAWLAVCKLNLAAEWACDSAAADRNGENSSYARALLCMCTARTEYLIGAHGIGSSDLKQRVQRLLGEEKVGTRFGNMALYSLALVILLCGWINLRLITPTIAAPFARAASQDDAELESNIDDLVGKLSCKSVLDQKFYQLAQSRAGKIAISNSVQDIENQMRQEASKNVVPEFVESHVGPDFQQQMAREVVLAKKDIANLQKALDEIRTRMAGKSDADKLFQRFLKNESAAFVLYFAEMRKQMRPGQKRLMQRLGRFLAKRNDGKFIVRESAKAPLVEKLKRFESADEQIEFLQKEMSMLADELVAKDDLHKKLKQRMISSRAAGFVLAHAFERSDPLDDQINEYLNELEHFFEDAPEGLVVNEEAREHLVQAMNEMDQMIDKMEKLKGPILQIVAAIDSDNGVPEAMVKAFLNSETGLAILSLQVDVNPTDSAGIAQRIKSEILQETDAGLIVREDRQEEVSEFSKELLRANRNLRRQLRIVDNRTKDIPEKKIGSLLDSNESKLILVEKVQQYLQQQNFDAWPTWVEQYFRQVDGKYVLREQAEELVDRLVEEQKQIQQELLNDDF